MPHSFRSPVKTRYPEKGMMISEGRGMQALSMAISRTMPPYPRVEIVAMTNPASREITFSIMPHLLHRPSLAAKLVSIMEHEGPGFAQGRDSLLDLAHGSHAALHWHPLDF